MAHKFTEEQGRFIREECIGITSFELTKLFNEKFNTELGVNQIRAYKKNHKIRSGLNTTFKKGDEPFNKGTKGICKPNKTSFKKGNTPYNTLPVGSEAIRDDGYIQVKIAEPNKWELKQRLIYEQYKGKIPKGYKVLFGDGNKRNFSIENLILVSNKQLQVMNNKKLIQNDADLTKTGLLIADVIIKMNELR
ncbi:MAG: HNH endonuclease signature motif containing protein [Clostridium celatum]|nr:HNH endonuclease signature motif containing protein [Clostridium celatum]